MSGSAPRLDAPLRIAYLTYRGKPHVGGQGVYTRHLTKALVDLGHHVEVFSGQPYPVLDERVPMTKLPSLDVFNDQYPGRFPAYWEIKTREDILELAQFSTGTFPEPLAFSFRALRHLTPRAGEFDLVHDNQCLGYGILRLERVIPTIVTLHHPITKDRQLEMDHAPNRRKRWSVGRWYSFVKMQGRVASRMPRIVVVSENSIHDIHTDMGVGYDRMRLVPVGVDPELFRPRPEVERDPRPPHHDGVGRRRPQGPGLPARGDGQAAHRARRHADDHRQAQATARAWTSSARSACSPTSTSSRASPTSGSSSSTPRPSWPSCRACTRASACRRSRRWSPGTALVATDGGALPEVTGHDGDTVLSCRAGDADALAATIRRGLDDPELRARVGAAGRKRVLDRWTWRKCAEQTVEQYREVLAMPANVEKSRPQRTGPGVTC